MKTIKVKKLHENSKLPTYGTPGAACFDLYSSEDATWKEVVVDVFKGGTISAYEAVVPTGLAVELPEGYRLDLYPRSGWGFTKNIQLGNGTGKIDEDYRGEVMVKLIAFCKLRELPSLDAGTRIAQGELNLVTKTDFEVVEDISETERGENGIGSTGTK